MPDAQSPKRRPGRPRIRQGGGPEHYIGIKGTADMRNLLTAAAKAANRSMSAEAMYRLERSFDPPPFEAAYTVRQRAIAAGYLLAQTDPDGPDEMLSLALRDLLTLPEPERKRLFQRMVRRMAEFQGNHPEVKGDGK